MEDNGDDTGSKLSRKGNGSAEVGTKQAVHDTYGSSIFTDLRPFLPFWG